MNEPLLYEPFDSDGVAHDMCQDNGGQWVHIEDYERLSCEGERRLDALELAWGLIANAYGGNWNEALYDWRQAAQRWRDEQWHPILHDATQGQSDAPERVSEELPQDDGEGQAAALSEIDR